MNKDRITALVAVHDFERSAFSTLVVSDDGQRVDGKVGIGCHLESVVDEAVRLAQRLVCEGVIAPVCFDFNEVPLIAQATSTVADIMGAYDAECDRRSKAYWTPERLAEEAQREAEAKVRDEAAAAKRAAMVGYDFTDDMAWVTSRVGGALTGRLDGMPLEYERATRDMVRAGILWLDAHPEIDPSSGMSQTHLEALEAHLCDMEPGCSGAMMGAAVWHARRARMTGWETYQRESREAWAKQLAAQAAAPAAEEKAEEDPLP